MAQVNIRLSDADIEKYRAAAESKGQTLSEYVRDVLARTLTKTCPRCKGTGRLPR